MTQKLIAQGAEAKIYLVSPSNTPIEITKSDEIAWETPVNPNINERSSTILKARLTKSYRHPTLDQQIRTRRTRSEAKILKKAHLLNINVPEIISIEKFNLELEYLNGDKLSQTLNTYTEKKQFNIMNQLGIQVTKLHENDLIHGDLTTSNTILVKNNVFIIDFGLGFISKKIEDKAVDLHLIKQALVAKHFQNNEALFENFLKGYKPKEKKEILLRLTAVEKRGRYRH